MKKNIHAKAYAYGGVPVPLAPWHLSGVATDTDPGNDTATVEVIIGIAGGGVGVEVQRDLTEDNTVAVCGTGVGFASELHSDYSSCKIELVSETATGPSQTLYPSHEPDDKWLLGKEGTKKEAEWEAGYRLEKNGISADASATLSMGYQWGVTDTLPHYAD